jgi:hypothetical protein
MSEMICTCSIEGINEAAALRLSVWRQLRCPVDQFGVDLVRSIRIGFGATVRCDSDQWFGVGFDAANGVGGFIECDHPLDGYAWVWQQLAAAFPEKAKAQLRANGGADAGDAAASRIAQYEAERAAYDAHKVDCAACNPDWPPCAEGRRLFDAYVATHRGIYDAWGCPDYDTDREWWGDHETTRIDAAAPPA